MPGETNKESKPREKSRPDLITFAGLAVALAGILGGLLIEGGKIRDVIQFTAALIVLGGTLGAVMVSTPLHVLKRRRRKTIGRRVYGFLAGPERHHGGTDRLRDQVLVRTAWCRWSRKWTPSPILSSARL